MDSGSWLLDSEYSRDLSAGNVTIVDKIVHTACAAHNWLTNNAMGTYLPRGSVDTEDIDGGEIIPGSWRSEVRGMVDIGRSGSNHHSQQAKAIREAYKKYFVNEGRVSWQNRMVH